MKSLIRNILAVLYMGSGFYRRIHKGKVLILTYHRILRTEEMTETLIQPGMYVEKEIFEEHIRFLCRNYEILSFEELLDHYRNNNLKSNHQYCLITFDDGWKDNFDNVFPILKKYNVPATIFLTVSLIGTKNCLWQERFAHLVSILELKGGFDCYHSAIEAAKKWGLQNSGIEKLFGLNQNSSEKLFIFDSTVEALKKFPEEAIFSFLREMESSSKAELIDNRLMLDWREIRQMSDSRISFGSHGLSHSILTHLSDEYIEHEIKRSAEILKDRKINYVPVFSYPNGNYTDEIVRKVQSTGYLAAVTTCFGSNALDQNDRFALYRIAVHNDISMNTSLFALQLSGLLQFLKKKHPIRA